MSRPNEPHEFIPLDRTFHELSSHASESDDFDLSQAFHVRGDVAWAELLQNYRVVILSEAGSGKTQEIRHAAMRLRSDQKDAFFLRLENIPEHFNVAFEKDTGTLGQFEDWLSSDREGWVLLDSVDEARLRHALDFELAIRKLGERLALALDRTHILMTGRTSAWRPKTDLEKCTELLPFDSDRTVSLQEHDEQDDVASDIAAEILDANEDDLEPSADRAISTEVDRRRELSSPFKVVTLAGLSRKQIETFATKRKVKGVTEFLNAIDQADAWSFASRPQDLEELIAFWEKNEKIGGRLGIMQSSVERRLEERDRNRADTYPLSHNKAYDGALLLAAATTLGNNPVIQVNDGQETALGGIRVDQVLPAWNSKEANALLDRPIFDPAIYGAQRFHHRSVREYLTAAWLERMLAHPTSRRAIEGLFFKRQYGVEIVVPAMRPVLPWMALFDVRIRERVQEAAPEVLFEGGDPSALPSSVRRSILEAVTAEIAAGETPGSPTDYSAVQRFANHDIAADIRRLLKQYATNDDAASFLLRMVELGRLDEALPEALKQALNAKLGINQRTAAFRAVEKIGTDEDMRRIRASLLEEPLPLSRELVGELIPDAAETSEDFIGWLLVAVERVQVSKRFAIDRFLEGLSKFASVLVEARLPQLVEGLGELLGREPYNDRRFHRISEQFGWLLEPAAKAVERLILGRNSGALTESSLRIITLVHGARHYGTDHREIAADFANLVPQWQELNRAAFWAAAREARYGAGIQPVTNPWQVGVFGAFWQFTAEDFEYFCDQVVERDLLDDKLLALSLAFDTYVLAGRTRTGYSRLKAVGGAVPELSSRLDMLLNPPPRDETTSAERSWKREAKARETRDKISREKSRSYIRDHVAEIRDPKFPNPNDFSRTQWYLHHQMRDAQKDSGKWTSGDWRSLIDEFGQDVAEAFRDAVVAYWRKANPITRSEGAVANQTSGVAIFGLTGLAIEARETPNWAMTLNEHDALCASRYASHELNGFPTWFPALYEAHPKTVADFLMHELAYELETEPEDGMHYIIDDLAYSGKWAWRDLGPRILELISKVEPRRGETLDHLLQMISESDIIPNADIAQLAASHIADHGHCKHPASWFAAWTGVAPDDAIHELQLYVDGLPTHEERTEFAMVYVTRLVGDRYNRSSITRPAYRNPATLAKLYEVIHRHIRRAEDIDRTDGEAYSPELRDRAQEARDSILTILNGIPGKAAYLAMMHVADIEQQASTGAWIRYRANQKAAQEGDLVPWTPLQVVEFNDYQERTPASHRELAELAVGRLQDLKDDLENGDSSLAAILLPVTQETDIRKFIGRELREKASGRYSIPQEEELADAKRMDFRFHRSEIDAPVPVELKLADKWSGPELFERLESQLSRDYLRDHRSTIGIYLLIHQGRKSEWVTPVEGTVDFAGLVEALQSYWVSISHQHPNVEQLEVLGIDLTARARRPASR